MDRLEVNPLYKDLLEQLGLFRPDDFLRLSGVIWCGHPDRNVAHLTLGADDAAISVFLKKEHRVPWKDRLQNALAGFGFVSKSLREARFLRAAAGAGIRCPEVIAAGECRNRAFLLVREIDGAVDLRTYLDQHAEARRPQLFRELGRAVAELHKRGMVHNDLFSKHVLVRRDSAGEVQISFLDWQRARRTRGVSWSRCYRELARLDATLTAELCSTRERLTFLREYLRAAQKTMETRSASKGDLQSPALALRAGTVRLSLSRRANMIRKFSERLLRKRYVREMRQIPLPAGQQNLVWLDGETACVTREFIALITERPTDAPPGPSDSSRALQALHELKHQVHVQCRQIVRMNDSCNEAVLVRREESRFWSWLWRGVRRRSFSSKELSLAATLFRLQRFGVPVPKLLAVGQEFPAPWQVRSFLLLEHTSLPSLHDWRQNNADENLERTLLAQSAVLLQRIHEAGYILARNCDPLDIFAVHAKGDETPTVVLRDASVLCRTGRG